MSEHRRDDTAVPEEATVERLRAVVRGEDAAEEAGSPVDPDLIWRAVSGELPAEERRAVVERVAADPAWAAAWRLAHELNRASRQSSSDEREDLRGSRARGSGGASRDERRFRFAWSRPLWGAVATAALVLVVVAVKLPEDSDAPNLRGQDTAGLVSRVPEDAALRRNDCVLRWSGGAEGTRWSVRLSTEDLRWVHRADSLEKSEYRVPEAVLAPLEAGTKLLWQVEARLPDGQVLRSATFVNRVD
ncbi:hypothetical protein LXT21_36195 [Myxococcus sp. K38C18041901]|uniref:hypothetical protein n=1 Tax=Myxococcus guangdongensis TaxID=2906760 RepID=UPI0020A7D33D|nr:hypothetical protein [Myxococcus guangdongensis]MCP3064229.1 hypothetical protein [Myxococcus guangdongensis]